MKDFEGTAKKYGIDFALKKDISENPPRYLVFFKGRDADVMEPAFKEYMAKNLRKEKKPSVKKALSAFKEAAKKNHKTREKVKVKDRGVEL
ncbi:PcfB family protein [Treponema denticola]|uniref:PcfB family protein n=1 Tax=Treponema denticola TaxID=158 RepID=UPI0009B75EBB|nr:PcfB family protein [Treponema sp.]